MLRQLRSPAWGPVLVALGGATVGVLELAAQGAATGLSASTIIGIGAVGGALAFFLGYKVYRHFRKLNR